MPSSTPTTAASTAEANAVVTALLAALPPCSVVTSTDAVRARLTDASGAAGGRPVVLVRPATTAEVSAVLAIATRHRIAVVPQGGLSGLAGGATSVEGAILLDLTAMNAIVRIDPVDQVVVVEPGVVVDDLAVAVAAHGLFYPPDPASSAWCTIGGTIATNAGGMRCVKYGVTRDFVRSLEVVLADGSVVITRPATVKAVAGLDLTGLVVGSEGTLAVVTQATLALLPAPGPVRGISATFGTVTDALAAANSIMAGPHRPSTLELLDGVVLDAIATFAPSVALPAGAGAWLLALTDARVGADDDLAAFGAAFTAHGALGIEVADGPGRVDDLLAARRAFNPAMRALRGGSVNEDVAVPRSQLGALLDLLAEVADRRGVVIGSAGHVGDGNLHPVVAYDPDDAGQVAAAGRAHEEILTLAHRLGGTVTGEHGIGVEKLGALDQELGPRVRELQRAVKAALDPLGILNPGKKI